MRFALATNDGNFSLWLSANANPDTGFPPPPSPVTPVFSDCGLYTMYTYLVIVNGGVILFPGEPQTTLIKLKPNSGSLTTNSYQAYIQTLSVTQRLSVTSTESFSILKSLYFVQILVLVSMLLDK